MRKGQKILVKILAFIAIFAMLSTTCFAAWWGTPGYEWGLQKGLTAVKSQSKLDQPVTMEDLYTTIVKYLEFKGVNPSQKSIHHNDDMTYLNNVVAGVFELVNSYTSRTSLTPDEYRIAASYVDHGRKTFDQYRNYITKNNVKNIDLYLSLSKYKAANLIDDKEYRDYVLSQLGNVKNTAILDYGIIPYAGDMTRREFLLLMYSLLSNDSASDESVLEQFEDTRILEGYAGDLMLDKELTYSEMLTFLYRFEVFDFNPAEEEGEIEE